VRVLVAAADRGELPSARAALAELATSGEAEIAPADYDEALRLLRGGACDVCLVGERAGDRHGLELLAEATTTGALAPIVFVAAAAHPEQEARALELGAADCLIDGEITPSSLARALRLARERVRTLAALQVSAAHHRAMFEEHLAITDRMASVGLLASGVAHEINNPLAAVIANLDMLHDELARDQSSPVARDLLDDARQAAVRIREIVRGLKLFSRPDEERRAAVDVRTALESASRIAMNEIRHRAQLVCDLREVPPVWANEARLGQVFLTLIVNAAQAIAEGAAARHRIRLRTYPAHGMVVIEVCDTGERLPPERRSDASSPETGLGLSICRRIIHELDGRIEVTSDAERGTTVRVHIPPAKVEVAAPEPRTPPPARSMRRGRILVVDDEHMITTALQRILGTNHEVTCFNAAEQALRTILGGERYDVIICDLMMPQMTGMELHSALDRLAPDQAGAMVFLTGGAFTEAGAAFLDRIANVRVEKPFGSRHLRNLVDELVDARTGNGYARQGK
jgi:signal transduction histidine kinase